MLHDRHLHYLTYERGFEAGILGCYTNKQWPRGVNDNSRDAYVACANGTGVVEPAMCYGGLT
jgi:hypothetical protein